MFYELLPHHIASDDRCLPWKLVPELKVLIKFSPAFRNICGYHTEQVIQEFKDELIVLISIFF